MWVNVIQGHQRFLSAFGLVGLLIFGAMSLPACGGSKAGDAEHPSDDDAPVDGDDDDLTSDDPSAGTNEGDGDASVPTPADHDVDVPPAP